MRTIERRTEMMRISEQFLELVSVFKEAWYFYVYISLLDLSMFVCSNLSTYDLVTNCAQVSIKVKKI
jgi:hypothetical protein